MKPQKQLIKFFKKQVKSYGNQIFTKGSVLRFDLTESPYGPTIKIKKILANLDILKLAHYPDPNPLKLKKTISEVFSVKTECISIGNGVSDLIDRIADTFLDETRSTLVLTPTFFRFIESSAKKGARIIEVKCKYEDSFSITEEIQKKWFKIIKEKQPDVIWVCNPNNPTGVIVPKKFIERTLKESSKLVVVDEVNFELIEKSETSSLELIGKHKNLVVLRSLSKVYGLAGIRFGFAVAEKPISLLLEKTRPRHHVASIVRDIAQIAISDQEHINKVVNLITKDIEEFKKELKAMKTIKSVTNTNTNVFILEKLGSDLFSELIKKGVVTTDLRGYNGIGNKMLIRISLRDRKTNMKLINILKEIDKL